MKKRIKYTKMQVKKWIFWKTIEKFTTFDNAKEHLDKLKKVDNFNNKSLNESNVVKIKVLARLIDE